jgi:hypothetical protein
MSNPLAAVLSEWATLVTSIGILLGIVASLFQGKKLGNGVGDVHDLVNNRSQQQDDRIEQLGQTLTDSGVKVPPKP